MPAPTAFDRSMALAARLDGLIADGAGDSPEADALRDAMDGPWDGMTEAERARARREAVVRSKRRDELGILKNVV